jgi:tetratricopeptide (TPR) repeat protein
MARKRARGAQRSKSAKPRRGRPGIARLSSLLLVIAALGGLWWWTRRPSPPAGGAGPHPAGSHDEASQAGLDLAHAGRHLEAIAYFREAVRFEPSDPLAHENLASGLGNGAQQARVHLGKTDNAVRSSVERIAMMRETMAETDAAQRLARTRGERVLALLEQGRTLYSWGFPVDALARMRKAAEIAPDMAVVQTSVSKLERELATGTR